MSEQDSDRISDNLGDIVSAAPISSNSSDTSVDPTSGPAKDAVSVESPKLAPEETKDAPKVDPPVGALKVDEKPETNAGAQKSASKIMIVSAPRGHSWDGDSSHPESTAAAGKSGMFGKGRVAALAAVIVLAAVAGAIGGALATAGLGHFTGDAPKAATNRALEDTISRIDTEVAALRTNLEQASKHSAAQIGKTGERLDRIEKAQAEPVAKLAKLSEAVDKLRAASATAPPVAAAAVAPKETTASIQPANAAPVPLPAPKPEVARLPTVEGWILRDVSNGSALIEGRQGMYEVYAGDPIPGLGRVDAIRKQDGRWVVVTSKGLIVAR